jgi:hypothetical protein
MNKKTCTFCHKSISKSNYSRHIKNHSFCKICNSYTSKKRHHIHDNHSGVDIDPEPNIPYSSADTVQCWLPLVIPTETFKRLWPPGKYNLTNYEDSSIPLPVISIPSPPNFGEVLDGFLPQEKPTITFESFESNLKPSNLNTPTVSTTDEDVLNSILSIVPQDAELDEMVKELKIAIKDAPDFDSAFDQYFWSDMRCWRYSYDLVKELTKNNE